MHDISQVMCCVKGVSANHLAINFSAPVHPGFFFYIRGQEEGEGLAASYLLVSASSQHWQLILVQPLLELSKASLNVPIKRQH